MERVRVFGVYPLQCRQGVVLGHKRDPGHSSSLSAAALALSRLGRNGREYVDPLAAYILFSLPSQRSSGPGALGS